MGLSIASTSATTPVAGVQAVSQTTKVTGGGMTFGVQQAMAGALTAQPGSGVSIIKRVLIGGAAGAALGFGASFFTLPIIGQVGAPIAAAVGGGIGAALGLISGLLARRKARAAQQTAIAPGAGVAPNIIPQVAQGRTIGPGSKGSNVKLVQQNLKALGLYNGKIDSKYNKELGKAISTYEIMKGVQPSGTGSPQFRAALAQDVQLRNRFV